MEDYGLVSVITPAFNVGKVISKMIRSVLNQTYTNWELLITDDCSTDDTKEVIEKFSLIDSRIKYFCLDKMMTVCVASTAVMHNYVTNGFLGQCYFKIVHTILNASHTPCRVPEGILFAI